MHRVSMRQSALRHHNDAESTDVFWPAADDATSVSPALEGDMLFSPNCISLARALREIGARRRLIEIQIVHPDAVKIVLVSRRS